MAVLSSREIIPRNFEHRLGGKPTASRVFVATLDGPTDASAVISAIGIGHGSGHPDHALLVCDGITAEDSDQYHTQITYSYGIPDKDNNEDPPWLQPDKWHFSTSNASVACKSHYVGAGNANRVRLENTAGDPIFGISMAESELKITISGARLTFDLAKTKKYVNCINDAAWAGFPKHTVQCVGVSANPAKIDWDGDVVNYWEVSVELLYRSSTYNLLLPNVGWHVIVDGMKQRAWTYIKEKGETYKVPAPQPVALNDAGGFLCGPEGEDGVSYYGS